MPSILFLHPNFPGQFKLLSRALAARNDCRVAAIGHGPRGSEEFSNIEYRHYDRPTGIPELTFPPIQIAADNIRRGRSVADIMLELQKDGFNPDHIIAHPGWGDAAFVRDVFPNANLIVYLEYYYRARRSDVDFDPEFTIPAPDLPFTRFRNITNLLAFAECDDAITPTEWQASLFPEKLSRQLIVQHEGIDCSAARPASAIFELPNGQTLKKDDEVVTYVARSLEPYRGFHIFMRALPRLLTLRPQARVVIVGKEGVSYGQHPRTGGSWKSLLLQEVEGQIDASRVHFVDQVPYERLIDLFNVSSAHAYLTYPFVLSWSLLEAMACECPIVASRTGPVSEVVTDGETGRLVDFFSVSELADQIAALLADRMEATRLGHTARQYVLSRYDFMSNVLPFFNRLLGIAPE